MLHKVWRSPSRVWTTKADKLPERLRLARLCHQLRRRTPDAQAGHSILIYRLSAEEVQEALYGVVAR